MKKQAKAKKPPQNKRHPAMNIRVAKVLGRGGEELFKNKAAHWRWQSAGAR
jgi:hypothetical protein